MSENKKGSICMSCMRPVPEGAECCPSCGYDGTQQNPVGLLPIGARLDRGSYIVGRITRIGKSSVVYAGYAVEDYAPCWIREYFPSGNCVREKGETRLNPTASAVEIYRSGLAAFAETCRKLSGVPEGTALPRHLGCFTENGTAYSVTDQFEGMTLRELLKRNGGTLTAEQTAKVMGPVLAALEALGELGLVHGGVCPDNIRINLNGDVRLNGFGSGEGAKAEDLAGYAAPEVYAGKEIGTAADVYGAGAVFYRCLSGAEPQDAEERKKEDGLVRLTGTLEEERLLSAVWKCLKMEVSQRPQSIREFAEAAGLEIPAPMRKEPGNMAVGKGKRDRTFRRKLLITLGLSLLGVAVLAGLLFLLLN